MDLSTEQLLWMYERMQLIRTFENRVKVEFGKGKIPGFVHLYAGEEAVAVGICAHLADTDYMTSTHRGHDRNFTSAGNRRRQSVDVPDILIANEDVDVLSDLALFGSDAVTQTRVNCPQRR